MSQKQWVPLESNPEVLTKFGHKLGLSSLLSFYDVWSLELLDMVPSPRYAVILLFPLTKKMLSCEDVEEANFENDVCKQPYFCKQTIGNACGTIAVIHAALNATKKGFPLKDGSFLHGFADKTIHMSASERAQMLQEDNSLDAVHDEFAQQGQTAAPEADEKVEVHFVCFVEHDGIMFELDGRKEAAVKHGKSSGENLLQDAGKVIKDKFMARDTSEHRFTILALALNS